MDNTRMTEKIIETRSVIKNKLEALKRMQENDEKRFSPITKHLQVISDNLKKSPEVSGDIYSFPIPTIHEAYTPKALKKFEVQLTTPQRISSNRRISNKLSKLRNSIKNIGRKKLSFDTENDDCDAVSKESYCDVKKEKEEAGITTNITQFVPVDAIAEHNPEVNIENYQFDDIIDKAADESKVYMEPFLDTPLYNEYMQDFDPLPRSYLDQMFRDYKAGKQKNQTFDHRTGIRHDGAAEKFYIGRSEIKFDGPDISVDGRKFMGTNGLYELMFLQNPQNYTVDDSEKYKEILEISAAARKYFDPSEQVLGNRSLKYRKIISKLVEGSESTRKKKQGGNLLMENHNGPIAYIHWDDPNELVERLKLLGSEQRNYFDN